MIGRVIVTLLARTLTKGAAAVGVASALAACTENVVAPAVCPEYCPPAKLVVVDTILLASIENDSSYSDYVFGHRAKRIQVAQDDSVVSNAVFRFQDFNQEILIGGNVEGSVVAVDSFRLEFQITGRSTATEATEIAVHRLPPSIDSTTTYAELEPYFEDSAMVAVVQLPDTVTSDTVRIILPGDAFPNLVEDSLVASVGLAYRSIQAGFANVVTTDSTALATLLIRYAQVDSAGATQVAASDTVRAVFDTFVFSTSLVTDVNTLTVGSSPATRALIRTNVPTQIVDLSSVVRATLILVPSEPIAGITGDSLVIRAQALSTDVGAKSPIVSLQTDAEGLGVIVVPAGWSDTVRVEVTHLFRLWKASPSLPRAMVLRTSPEGGSLSYARFGSSRSAVGVPSLHVSYVPPVIMQFEGGQ